MYTQYEKFEFQMQWFFICLIYALEREESNDVMIKRIE